MTGRTARRAVGAVLAVIALLAAWAAACSVLAARELTRAQAVVQADGELDPAALKQAEAHARRAEGLLRQPGPALAQHLPILGRSVRAVRVVAESGAVTIGSAGSVADALTQRDLLRDGRLDLAAVDELHAGLNAASLAMGPPLQRLAALDPELLPRPVARGVRQAQQELLGADADAARAAALTGVLPDLLGAQRPRNVLVVLQNNAELRGTGGLISTFATGVARQGALQLQPFRDVLEVADPPASARRVPAAAEFVEQYGSFLANTTLWRNANMSPDAPASNQVLAAVASRSLGRPFDVVLSLDVRAMAELTGALGSVQLPDGTTLTADELAEELYAKSYEGLEFSGQARRKVLRAAADDALARVLSGQAAPAPLARRLAAAVAGRHLSLWSANPEEQAALEAGGAAGAVRAGGGDLAMVISHNLGGPGHLKGGGPGEGNKLDYYVRRQLGVSAVLQANGTAEVTQRLQLTNEAPPGLGPYAAGFTVPGRVTSLLSLYAGGDAVVSGLTQDGRPQPARTSKELGATVVRVVSRLDRGKSTVYELRYRIPLQGRSYRLRAVPQPLARDAAIALALRPGPGVSLEVRDGGRWVAGGVETQRPLDAIQDLHVRVADPPDGLLQRVRDFWTSPARG